jgi:prephenate dehydrogenase
MPAPRLRRIAIVGVGLIGGSIGLAVRRLPRTHVVGIDRRDVLRRARRRGAIHQGTTSLRLGLRQAELVVLALPVEGIAGILPRVARHAADGAIVTDVGSTKVAIRQAAVSAGLGRRYVGGHPMAGSERSGVENADGRLFQGAPWIVCPIRGVHARAVVMRFVRALGARPMLLTAERHDTVVARVSHLPQLLSVALVNSVAPSIGARARALAGPAFRQMSRLAASPAHLWRDILRTNHLPVRRALDEFSRELVRLRSDLPTGASASFRRAARARSRLTAVTRGRRTGRGTRGK